MTRRVVTGMDANGKSVFVNDGELDVITMALLPGTAVSEVWASAATPRTQTALASPGMASYFPPPGGVRYGLWTFPPEEGAGVLPDGVDIGAALADLDAKLPGMSSHLEPDSPGMHTTQTVDVGLVLSGEIELELDDGAITHLSAGDFVIQNGTRHAWRNRSGAPTTMAFVLIGANLD